MTVICWCACYRALTSPSLHLAVTANHCHNHIVSGISRCFVYLKRLLPSTLTDVIGDGCTTKRTRLSVVEPPDAGNLLSEQDYCGLFCPHSVKAVNSLLPRQEAHLVVVSDISRYRDVAFTGVTCSVIAVWRQDGDADSGTVYRTCGQVTLSAGDIVSPQRGLMFNSASVLSGLKAFLVQMLVTCPESQNSSTISINSFAFVHS